MKDKNCRDWSSTQEQEQLNQRGRVFKAGVGAEQGAGSGFGLLTSPGGIKLEGVHWLRTFALLPEDPGYQTLVRWLTATCNSSSRGPGALFWLLQVHTHM